MSQPEVPEVVHCCFQVVVVTQLLLNGKLIDYIMMIKQLLLVVILSQIKSLQEALFYDFS